MNKIPTTHSGDYGRLYDLKIPYPTSHILGLGNSHSCVWCNISFVKERCLAFFATGKWSALLYVFQKGVFTEKLCLAMITVKFILNISNCDSGIILYQ